MFATPNMNLVVWDQLTDDFSNTQLAANFQEIDRHDHSNGNGVQINTAGIAPLAIVNSLMAPDSVTQSNLVDNSVGNPQLQPNSVTTDKIQDSTILAADIAPNVIGYGQLDANVVPLGSVMQWYRAPGLATSPGGNWEVMDGRAWSSITNRMGSGGTQLNTGNIPNMTNQYLRGTGIGTTGTTGGSNTVNLSHSHIVDSHVHEVPSHAHAIELDGLHAHTFMGGLPIFSRTNAFNIGFRTAYYPYNTGGTGSLDVTKNGSGVVTNVSFEGNEVGMWDNTYYTMYISGLGQVPGYSNTHGDVNPSWVDGPTPMDNAGQHNHGGATEGSANFNTTPSAPGTNSALGNTTIEPSYTGLLFIMRVR